jgi:putative salt-induced outer membrane protein
MRLPALAPAALLLSAAAAHADTVSLNNGDKLTGAIEEVTPTTIVLTSPYAGRLLIDRAAVKALQSEKPVSIVRPDGGKDARFLSPAPDGPGWQETAAYVPPAPPPAAKPAAPARATSFLSLSPDWKNQAALGVMNTTGNDETTQFTGNLTFRYDHKPDELTLKFDAAYGMSNAKQTQGLFAQTAVYRRDFTDRAYAYLDDDLRYDAIKGISLQATATGGLGYYLVRNDKFKLDVRGGPGVTYLKTFDGNEDVAPAVEAGVRLSYVFNERVSSTHETTYTSSLTDFDVWRVHSETALNVKLDLERGLGLKLAFNDDYENQPSAGRKNNDTRLTLALTLDF